jgi:signal transduction histidine kinase/sensor domain CHASE-containing protein
MSKRKWMRFFAGMVAIMASVGGAGALYYVLLQSFDELDLRDVSENAGRAERTFLEQLETLESKVGDWGAWDEAFKYVSEGFMPFAESNITDAVIDALRITVVAYLDRDLKPVSAHEMVDGKLVPIKTDDLEFLNPKHSLIEASKEGVASGVVSLRGVAAVAAANVVSMGSGEGEKVGRVVFVRRVDADLEKTLSEQLLLRVHYEASNVANDDEVGKIITEVAHSKGKIELYDEIARGITPLTNDAGQDLGNVVVEIPRKISMFGRKTAKAVSIAFLVLSMFLIFALTRVARLMGVQQSLQKVREAQALLAKSERELKTLIDAVPGHVYMFDSAGHVVGGNERAMQNVKLGNATKRASIVDLGFEHEAMTQMLASSKESGSQGAQQGEIRGTGKNEGAYYLMNVDKVSGTEELVAVLIDVTETKKVQEQAAKDRAVAMQSSRLASLGEMAGGIAHEINNPLAIIQASARKITRLLSVATFADPEQLEKGRASLQTIETTSMRIAKIISGLRTVSRDGSGDPMQLVKIGEVLGDMAALCSQKFAQSGIKLNFNDSEHCVDEISCRATQVGQVLLNLLNNAYDAVLTNQDKWVDVSVKNEGGFISVLVMDSGLGIPPDVVEKMMNPFFTTKGVGKGTGLGLSIAVGIIKEHGGTLSYDPTSKNTRFEVKFPVLAQAQAAA